MSLFNRFVRDSGIYGISTVLRRAIGVLMLPFYARVFTTAELGVVEMLAIFSTLANVLVTLEISQAVSRFYPDAKEERKRSAYPSTVLWFALSSYLLFGCVFWLFSDGANALLLESPERAPVFRVAIFSIIVMGLFRLMQNQLRYELKSFPFSLINLLYSVLFALAVLFFVLVLKRGLSSIFYAQISAGTVGVALAWHFSRDHYRFAWDGKLFLEMLRFSLPLVPSSLAVFLYQYIDRISIREILSLSDLGIYAVGCRFASLVSLLLIGVNTALTPLIYHHYREDETPFEIARIFRFVMFFSFLILLGLTAFSTPLVLVFTTGKFLTAAPLIPILAATILAFQLYIFAPGLAIAKRTKTITLINIAVGLINTVFNLLLIPYFGLFGAAGASLTSGIILFTLYVRFSRKHYRINYSFGKILLGALILVCSYGLVYFLDAIYPPGNVFSLIIKLLLCLLGGLALGAVLISKEEGLAMVKKGRELLEFYKDAQDKQD